MDSLRPESSPHRGDLELGTVAERQMKTDDPLADRVRRGVLWCASGSFAKQLMRLGLGVILARLLTPAEFGLFAMAMFVVDFTQVFLDFGLTDAMIQKKEEEITADDWSSVYWIIVGLGMLVGVIVWVLAPAAAWFYQNDQVISIVRVAGWTALIGSLGATQATWFAKRMEFRSVAAVEFAGTLAGGAVAVTIAWLGWGVWTLVIYSLVSQGTGALLFYVKCPWRPGLNVRASTLRWALRFGVGLQGFGIVNYLNRRLDDAVVGRYVGPVGLGYYERAYQLMLYPMSNVAGVLGKVMFPALSEIGADLSRFRAAYLRTVSLIATVTFPVMLGLLVTAHETIAVVYGPQWMPAVPVLQVLCVVGFVQSVVTTVGWIYLTQGRTDVLFAWGVVASVVLCSSFFIGVWWGILGVAVAYALAYALILVPGLIIPFRLIRLSIIDFVRSLRGVFVGSVLMAGIVAMVRVSMLSGGASSPTVLITSVVTGIFTYLAWLWFTDAGVFQEIRLMWSRTSREQENQERTKDIVFDRPA